MTAEHSSEEGGEGLTASRWCSVHDEPAAECWSAECLAPTAPTTLTAVERRSLHPHAGNWPEFYAAVERILADRFAAVQAERDRARQDHHYAAMEASAAGDAAEHIEAALATARAERDDLRGRLAAVEALADEMWCHEPSRHMNEALHRVACPSCCHATRIRAALANPSAAQGEGEVEVECSPEGCGTQSPAEDWVPGVWADHDHTCVTHARAEHECSCGAKWEIATPAPEADQ